MTQKPNIEDKTMTQTTIQKDTRILTSTGDILRVLKVEDQDISKDDNKEEIVPVVTFCGTKTYKDAQSRGRATLSEILSKIEMGKLQIVTTKPAQSEIELGTGNSNWKPEVVA
ncbi:hypothetical protein IMZ68_03100 [Candidatus Bathyarchaeota archaeon]|nr:hypothetical protein [Candidatus Bathyarchaeota archaeon]MBE3141453.1 hypothetical protein [Thermoplasmata archaeon]